MCFIFNPFRCFTLKKWNICYLQKKKRRQFLIFLWRIKKLGHLFCYIGYCPIKLVESQDAYTVGVAVKILA